MRITFDNELYPNFFLAGFKHWDKEEYVFFEISERKNQSKDLIKYLKQNLILISFNGIHYDNLLFNYIILNKFKPTDQLLSGLVKLNKAIINDDYFNYKKFKRKRFTSIDVDLFLYWSKMLRLSKKISLKGLMVQLNMPLIQELPYDPNEMLSYEQMDEVIKYNINDLQATEKLAKAKEKEIKLRFDIHKQKGFPCHSWDQIKLASEELLHSYCEITGEDPRQIRQLRFEKPIIRIKDILPHFDFKTSVFKLLLQKLHTSVNTFSETVYFNCNKTTILLTYGMGGIHSVNRNQKFKTDSNYQLLTSDVASLYPTVIENYKLIRFVEVLKRYSTIKKERLLAKSGKLEGKDNNLYNTFYKLVLNGVSGLLDQAYSWLYYPEGAMKLRLMGQLILTKLIEEASLANFQVVSANTDGIEVLVDKNRLDEYYKLVNQVEQQFNVLFEHEFYDRIYYWSVNDYLAVIKQPNEVLPLDKLNIKQKGMMVTSPELSNSVDSLIIPKALNYYFIYGIPIEETIKQETNIYLFCNAPKVDKKFTVWWGGEKQQRLNRYYVSKSGEYLYKQKPNGNLENMLKGYTIQLLNDNREKTKYDINYQYYIRKCKELIEDIEPSQLKLF